jgi:23S rRNA (adenine2030-N6)-methyltransferase
MVLARDKQAKAMNLDGWAALKSLIPPKERRGVVLIDPPFEEPGELARLVVGLQDAVRRFATGIYILWYPIKDARPVYAFRREIEDLRFDKLLSVELLVRAVDGSGLAGCGMIILNPPFQLKEKLDRLLPFLADRLGQGTGSVGTTRWLTPQHQPTS